MFPKSTLSNLKPDCDGDTDLTCVTVAISSPLSTRSSNHLCRIELIDTTTNDIVICILIGCKDFLPNKRSISEPSLVRLTNVKVQYFAGRPQINSSINYTFSFFHPYEEIFEPLDQSQNYTGQLSEEEKIYMNSLRDWIVSPIFASTNFGAQFSSKDPMIIARQRDIAAVDTKLSSNPGKRTKIINNDALDDFNQLIVKKRLINKFKDYPISLENLSEDLYCNLNLQVIGVAECKSSYIIRCCDGTIPSVKTLKVSDKLVESNLSQQVLLQLDAYTVDVNVFDDHIIFAKSLKPGNFISLKNLHCYTPFGLSSPELILHGGNKYGRGVSKISPECRTAVKLQVKLDSIPLEVPEDIRVEPPPLDDPRCVQTSPTECLYPEQSLTSLASIAGSPQNRTLYKVRVYVHCHVPDSYASMVMFMCSNCLSVPDIKAESCSECDEGTVSKIAHFALVVQDESVSNPIEVYCARNLVTTFLSIDRINNGTDLVSLENVLGRWCDMHVLCLITPDQSVKVFLSHTIIKKNNVLMDKL